MQSLRRILARVLRPLGLLGVAQRANRWYLTWKFNLRARGLLPWKPLIPQEAFARTCASAIDGLLARGHQFGSYLEFGVSRGTSMACMYHALRGAGLGSVRLVGFDSFRGMPAQAADEGWIPGQFASTVEATERYLADSDVRLSEIQLVEGWFQDTLTPQTIERLELNKASVVLVDCDTYSASKKALWFCEPLIEDEAVLIFDDWGWRSDVGEVGQREAFHEFLAEFPDIRADPMPTYRPEARVFLVTRSADEGAGSSRSTRADVEGSVIDSG